MTTRLNKWKNCPKDRFRLLASRLLMMIGTLGVVSSLILVSLAAQSFANDATVSPLFTQQGNDSGFQSLVEQGRFPVGKDSRGGVTGSRINVNNQLVEKGIDGDKSIPREIAIHTPCCSHIPRKDFAKSSRWYQEDGNTQIFRLFKGDYNVRNSRQYAGRSEAFSKLSWKRGNWHQWEGTYTVFKPCNAAIFQAKNHTHAWSVMINLTEDGTIILNHRRHQEDKVIARNMTGKSFHLKVRDNGHDYEVFFNGRKIGSGHFERLTDTTKFRWGMYPEAKGGKAMKSDALVFVSGVSFE